MVNSVLNCDTTNEVSSQTCSFNGLPEISCLSPFNIRPLNLEQGDHTLSVSATDVFGQTDTFAFDFSTVPSAAISLSFEEQISLREGTTSAVPFLFTVIGQALEDIPFSLRSLTYQQFQDMTGSSVDSVFSGTTIPPPASESKSISTALLAIVIAMCLLCCLCTGDFDASYSESFTFTASQDMITTNYDISLSVPEDEVFEGNEGFVLYFVFDEGSINAGDYSRLETGTRAILVTITDNDQCK